MRWSLNRLALAITSMVALAFLVPLAVATRQIAYESAVSDARQQATAMVAVLAVDSDPQTLARAMASTAAGGAGRMAVYLPGSAPIGDTHVSAAAVSALSAAPRAGTIDVDGGLSYLQPTVLSDGRTAVIEVFVPRAETRHGVWPAWLALGALAIALVTGSVLLADRLGGRLVRATQDLAGSARRLGSGDLDVRLEPSGPRELRDAAVAFNTMGGDLQRLIGAERELAADLSHRLRTPLTALRLDAEALPDDTLGERMRQACDLLEAELEAIITGFRAGAGSRGSQRCDLREVLADRLAFWSVLAEDQQRPWQVAGAERPVIVGVGQDQLVMAVDALLGNIFAHTPEGTGFRVTVRDGELIVDDAGPGIPDPRAAVQRGVSGAGSTGLGLDIVRRIAEAGGGELRISRGPLGGARIAMTMPAVVEPAAASPMKRIGRRGHPA